MAVGAWGQPSSGGRYGGNGPNTNSVDVRPQKTVSNNGTNPSNKHWKSRNAGKIIPPVGTTTAGKAASPYGGTVRLNAGATKRFGGKPVGKLGKVGY